MIRTSSAAVSVVLGCVSCFGPVSVFGNNALILVQNSSVVRPLSASAFWHGSLARSCTVSGETPLFHMGAVVARAASPIIALNQ